MFSNAATSSPDCRSSLGGHPLEMIPLFARWPRSLGRDIVYNAIFNMIFAVAFASLALLFDQHVQFWEALRINTIFAQCIGYAIFFLFVLGERFAPGLHRRNWMTRAAYYGLVAIAGAFIGYWLASTLLGWSGFRQWLFTLRGFAAVALLALIITAILLTIFLSRERAARAEAAIAREQARVAAAERETTTARLKLLQAQVEPHFLYNTLANAISLIDTDGPAAKHMLERLIELLRATAAVPEGDGTIAEQLRWLRAYLDILALRMGSRLRWNIDVPPSVQAERVAPMLLQPIVENAVKHGIEPKVEGGRVDILGRRDGDVVRLTVRDTGLGFATRGGTATGLGLANLRARLAAWYGPAAQLVIEDNVPSGASVSLVLPAAAAP